MEILKDEEKSHFKIIWLENNLELDEILEILENCDKECDSCDDQKKTDCVLEMRESLYSLASIFKNAILSWIELIHYGPSGAERKPRKVESVYS